MAKLWGRVRQLRSFLRTQRQEYKVTTQPYNSTLFMAFHEYDSRQNRKSPAWLARAFAAVGRRPVPPRRSIAPFFWSRPSIALVARYCFCGLGPHLSGHGPSFARSFARSVDRAATCAAAPVATINYPVARYFVGILGPPSSVVHRLPLGVSIGSFFGHATARTAALIITYIVKTVVQR